MHSKLQTAFALNDCLLSFKRGQDWDETEFDEGK